ncbi:hypothetical protein AKJ09_09952 [Labilithrix luteola]|uniref:Aspartyl/asparaginy/proline hydroxylase domain-containing protein n=1 Tax=Labilithrix luteola TaxID=1391654 RepID=A0A0K1QC17_9BACT|nr:hypothetical protein [Labilithrix luteola]AKV03289.1 hypothetical protein AKJ09_09952 [Labilithrix luteola]
MIHGLFGRPFLDLSPYLDVTKGSHTLEATLSAIHEEVCRGLAEVPTDYTGGSHRSMGIMPPSRVDEALVDYGDVIAGFSPEQYEVFRALADDPSSLPTSLPAHAPSFGEERDHPLSRRQMLWLEQRFGVYFPWKVYFEMIPNRYWDEKSSADGKDFTRLAKTFFPQTIAFVRSLPFQEIGRCNVMGLAAHDHGTAHRDGDPDEKKKVDHFITICPAQNKTLFLWDEERREKTAVTGPAYWFNDSDYHGVEAAPFFRYSIRVDGVFRPDFLAKLEREHGGVSS